MLVTMSSKSRATLTCASLGEALYIVVNHPTEKTNTQVLPDHPTSKDKYKILD